MFNIILLNCITFQNTVSPNKRMQQISFTHNSLLIVISETIVIKCSIRKIPCNHTNSGGIY